MQEIEEADAEFRKAVQPLSREQIDVAFFPVDPRQGAMFEAGANYFILSVKPRILIPMHYFHRADTALDYARTASCRTTEVIAMPGFGDVLQVEADEDHFLNVSFLTPRAGTDPDENPVLPEETETGEIRQEEEVPAEPAAPQETGGEISGPDAAPAPAEAEQMLSENDPFLESDLPLTSLAEKSPEDPAEKPLKD